jgi:ketosteroid isomerase-like protein
VSDSNAELVRRSYEMINAIGRTEEFVDPERIAPEVWERTAPDFELHERPDLPDAKVYRGREAAKEFWRKSQELFAEMRWEPVEFTDLGHAVVVEARIVAVGRGSDVQIQADETDVFWFRDGLLVKLQGFPTKAEALAAAADPRD